MNPPGGGPGSIDIERVAEMLLAPGVHQGIARTAVKTQDVVSQFRTQHGQV